MKTISKGWKKGAKKHCILVIAITLSDFFLATFQLLITLDIDF